jgi:hypothetical protein
MSPGSTAHGEFVSGLLPHKQFNVGFQQVCIWPSTLAIALAARRSQGAAGCIRVAAGSLAQDV